MSNRLKAIPQEYKGFTLRSKLERMTAEKLDEYSFIWQYESEGYDLNGIWYLPDFWLPECQTFVEAKGIWDKDSLIKVHSLWKLALPLGITVAVSERFEGQIQFGLMRPTPADMEFVLWDRGAKLDFRSTVIAFCRYCNKPWFLSDEGGYRCQNCGAWDGDHHIEEWMMDNGLNELNPDSKHWPAEYIAIAATDPIFTRFQLDPAEDSDSLAKRKKRQRNTAVRMLMKLEEKYAHLVR